MKNVLKHGIARRETTQSHIIMPPTSDKLEGHIALGMCVSILLKLFEGTLLYFPYTTKNPYFDPQDTGRQLVSHNMNSAFAFLITINFMHSLAC